MAHTLAAAAGPSRARGAVSPHFVRRSIARSGKAPAATPSPQKVALKGGVSAFARHLELMTAVSEPAVHEAGSPLEALRARADLHGDATASAPQPERGALLAAMDIGTNSFHMVIVRCLESGRFEVVDQLKEFVRLGGGTSGFRIITEPGEQRALAVIRRFQRAAAAKGARMRAVATSAVREAHNREPFVRRVAEVTGVDVEVISGQEEARLIYMGVLQAMPVHERRALCIDIGGGSTEVVLGHRGEALATTSLRLGHVGLTERCVGESVHGDEPGASYATDDLLVEETRRAVASALAETDLRQMVEAAGGYEVAVGSSGTAATIAVMVNEMRRADETAAAAAAAVTPGPRSGRVNSAELTDIAFTRPELDALCARLLEVRTSERRAKLPGMNPKRVDVIVGGALLMRELFCALGIRAMRVSPYALREGVIVDWMGAVLTNYTPSCDIRRTSVLHLAKRFVPESRLQSGVHVGRLARALADGLTRSCGLDAVGDRKGGKGGKKGKAAKKAAAMRTDTMQGPPNAEMCEALLAMRAADWELMEAAALLHNVGLFVAHEGFHKHSWYIIKNNDHLMGYTPMEVEVIALLARYHRKKVPARKHERMRLLPPAVRNKVMVMASLLRVAVALERCHTGAVEGVHVLQRGSSTLLVVTPRMEADGTAADVSLELWAARQEISFMERVLACKCTIVEGSPGDSGEEAVRGYNGASLFSA